jgi:uncharacterized protein (TIGR03435 family)
VCGTGRARAGKISAIGWSIEQLGAALAPVAGRMVKERTGLSGLYDFDLAWTPEPLPVPRPDDQDPPAFDPAGPTIFAALQEQLGLRLQADRGPVEVVVEDRALKPTKE